jgi:hypothetical protein
MTAGLILNFWQNHGQQKYLDLKQHHRAQSLLLQLK